LSIAGGLAEAAAAGIFFASLRGGSASIRRQRLQRSRETSARVMQNRAERET
jgi:hypothetical protein